MGKKDKIEYVSAEIEKESGSKDNFTFFLILSIFLMVLIVVALFIYFTVYSEEEAQVVEVGKSFNMTKYQNAKFSIDGKEYSFSLDKINTNYINLSFNSTKIGLKTGEEKNVTLENNKIKIKLEKLDKEFSSLLISRIISVSNFSSLNNSLNQVNNQTNVSGNNISNNVSNNQSSNVQVTNVEIINKRCLTIGGKNCFTNQRCVGNIVQTIDNPKCCLGYCTVSFEVGACTANVRQKAAEACGEECSSCACINSNDSLSKSVNWTMKICLTMPGRDTKNKWTEVTSSICPLNRVINFTCVCGIYYCGQISNGKYWNYCQDDECKAQNNCWSKSDCDDSDRCTNDTCILTTNPGVCQYNYTTGCS